MSHKKRKTYSNASIEKALLQLDFPLKNNIGADVILKISNSSHSGSKHIAKAYHGLNENDISLLPSILKNPVYVTKDPIHREKKNYYGKRKGSNKILFIKIVTKIIDSKTEKIITVFTTKHINH